MGNKCSRFSCNEKKVKINISCQRNLNRMLKIPKGYENIKIQNCSEMFYDKAT